MTPRAPAALSFLLRVKSSTSRVNTVYENTNQAQVQWCMASHSLVLLGQLELLPELLLEECEARLERARAEGGVRQHDAPAEERHLVLGLGLGLGLGSGSG